MNNSTALRTTHYVTIIVPMANEDGSTYFMAYHPAFGQSTCSATGETEEESVDALREVRHAVIEHYQEKGYDLPTDASVEYHCDHSTATHFDAKEAQGLSSEEVRLRWPRGTHCPKCGGQGIFYASVEHYIAGDW